MALGASHAAPLDQRSTSSEIFTIGIKAIDVLPPLERGGKIGPFSGIGKTVLLSEMIHNTVSAYRGVSLFCDIGERCRDGGSLPRDVQCRRSAAHDDDFRANELTPENRFRVGHAH